MIIAACVVLPQPIVALLALCYIAVPLRAVLLAVVDDPLPPILVQALDGISAAGFGVLLPLIAADVTRGTNWFNLCLGVFGLMAAFGATLSTALGGLIADGYGTDVALLVLAGCGVAAVVLATVMPETRPERLVVLRTE